MKTQVIGNEFDERLLSRLRALFENAGATIHADAWGPVGSQEYLRWSVNVDGVEVIVESETYIGTSVSGPSDVVEWIAREMRVVKG